MTQQRTGRKRQRQAVEVQTSEDSVISSPRSEQSAEFVTTVARQSGSPMHNALDGEAEVRVRDGNQASGEQQSRVVHCLLY